MSRESYYILVQRSDDGTKTGRRTWSPQFGDFDRETVQFELDEYHDQGARKADLRILSCKTIGGKAPPQSFIDNMIAKLNAESK